MIFLYDQMWNIFLIGQVVRILSAVDPSVSGVNSVDEEGWAPLHSAASSGNVEIVDILLGRGDDYTHDLSLIFE